MIEEEFFKTFGIKPKYSDGCKLADKYWANEELADEYFTFDLYMEKNCPYRNKECYMDCKYSYDKCDYPEITAEKLLQLICILNELTGRLIELDSNNINDLKEEILQVSISNFTAFRMPYKKKFIQQVRKLFEE